jgi:nucleotide-binding universal stress UspA family protein
MAVGLLERLGFPTGQTAKIIDGHHPAQLSTNGNMPKPDMLPLPSAEEGKGAQTKRNVLVAISGKELDTELVTLGCTLAKVKKASLFVLYGIEVPRKLAMDAEMPAETATATSALERAAAIAEQMHVHIEPEIIQSRNFGQSMVDEASAHDCALLILGLPYHLGLGGHFDLGDTAEYVLKHAPCRVWLIRGQPPEAAAARSEREEPIAATR